jgi:hypothetical protein
LDGRNRDAAEVQIEPLRKLVEEIGATVVLPVFAFAEGTALVRRQSPDLVRANACYARDLSLTRALESRFTIAVNLAGAALTASLLGFDGTEQAIREALVTFDEWRTLIGNFWVAVAALTIHLLHTGQSARAATIVGYLEAHQPAALVFLAPQGQQPNLEHVISDAAVAGDWRAAGARMSNREFVWYAVTSLPPDPRDRHC